MNKNNITNNNLLNDNLSIGNIFGMISGVITSIGLMYGMYGAKINKKPIIIGLLSISLSDSISDAIGIYYGTDENIYEALTTLFSKFIIPFIMAFNFYILNINEAVVINTILCVGLLIIVNYKLENNKITKKLINNILFIIIIIFIIFNIGKVINNLKIWKFILFIYRNMNNNKKKLPPYPKVTQIIIYLIKSKLLSNKKN